MQDDDDKLLRVLFPRDSHAAVRRNPLREDAKRFDEEFAILAGFIYGHAQRTTSHLLFRNY
jgi:hypothetical protein